MFCVLVWLFDAETAANIIKWACQRKRVVETMKHEWKQKQMNEHEKEFAWVMTNGAQQQ